MNTQNINSLLQQGIKNLQRGYSTVAEDIFKKIIAINPRHPDALHLLGVSHSLQNKDKEAVRLIKKAIKINPKFGAYYRNLGLALAKLKRNIESINAFKKALLYDKTDAASHNDLAVLYSKEGMLEEAIYECNRAINKSPNYAEVYNNRGNVLQEMEQLDEAVKSYNKAIQIRPNYTEAYSNRGNALQGLGQMDEAVKSYNKAIQINPNSAEFYLNRGNALKGLGQLDDAVKSYNKAIQIRPNYTEAYSNRGTALQKLGQMDEAVKSYNKAIQISPDFAEAYNNRGNALKDLGHLDKAMKSYNKAIQINQDYVEAHRHLSAIKQYSTDDEQIVVMEGLYAKEGLKESDRMRLSFALAKAYEDLGDYDRSFNYLKEGNRLRKKELSYTIHKDRRLFSIIQNIFIPGQQTIDFVPNECSSIRPIFIVGMPRSGTSLVEQILSSHSEVHGAGELGGMGGICLSLMPQNSSQHQAQISRNDIKTVHEGYLNILTALKVSEKIITDKMPSNFLWIGFILSAFPEATIIHLNRDSIATCWSIYKHYFSSKGHGYAYDMDDLAEYYKMYTELMSFWHKRFPNRIYDLCYEDLTENQEKETRKLLQFCGLKWEQECLDFHKTKRVVRTASAVQVRKRMYKGSSEAWRKYEQQLQPLIANLCDS